MIDIDGAKEFADAAFVYGGAAIAWIFAGVFCHFMWDTRREKRAAAARLQNLKVRARS